MEVFLAGTSSLRLTRAARKEPGLSLVPVSNGDLSSLRNPHSQVLPDLDVLRCTLPPSALPFDACHPLELLFFSRQGRSQSRLVRSRTLLAPLPGTAFLEVEGLRMHPQSPMRVFVESAALSLIHMGQLALERVSQGLLSEQAALMRLMALAMEACGSYAKDSADPGRAECAYGVEPLATPSQIVDFLERLSKVRGVVLARKAARWAKSGSASPSETLISLGMRLPLRLGGIPMPDFHWVAQRKVLEHLGRYHGESRRYEEDHFRAQDYEACGIALTMSTHEDIKSPEAFERLALLVAKDLARYEGAFVSSRGA